MFFSYLKQLIKFLINVTLGTIIATGIVMTTVIIFLVIFVSIIVSFGKDSSLTDISRETLFGKKDAKFHFISIPIHGLIVGDDSDIGEPLGIFQQSTTMGYDIKKTLYTLADDDTVSGIILDINSPGGTIYGANAIAQGVAYYKEKTKKPVFAFVSGLAASGAYWSAISADRIVADVGTSVGSIGVISGPFQYYDTVIAQDGGILSGGVVTQKGIESIYITAGKSKDIGNPYRRLTKEELSSLQSMVNHEYESFVSYVATRRKIEPQTIKGTLGALLYDGKSAIENKLIDTIGSREDAYTLLAKAAEISGDDYSVEKEVTKKGFLQNLLQSRIFFSTPVSRSSTCTLTKVDLVYHGDISVLCQ